MKQPQIQLMTPVSERTPITLACASLLYLAGFWLFDELSKAFEIWPSVSVWYPPAGLSLALMIICGARLAPVLVLANVFSFTVVHGGALDWAVVSTSIIHAVCYAIAGEILRRMLPDRQLTTTKAAVRFMLVALVAPLPIALIACVLLVLTGSLMWADYLRVVLGWWLGDGIGALVIAPLLLVHAYPILHSIGRQSALITWQRWSESINWIEIMGQLVGSVSVLWLIFFSPLANQQALFLCFVSLIWIALRSGITGATFAVWLLSFGAAYAAVLADFPPSQIVRLQLLMIALAITGLALGAAVSEQHQLARVLKQSEARIRAIVDEQLDLVCRYGMDTRLTFVNDAYCQFFGKAAVELIGQSFLPMSRPEYYEIIFQQIARTIETREVIVDESLIYRNDGSLRWMQWINRAIVDEYDHVSEIQVVGRDITERRRAEEAYRSLVDQSLQGMAIIQNQQILFVNPALSAMLDYPLEHFLQIGDPLTLFHPSDQRVIERMVTDVRIPGVQQSAEVRVRCSNGTYRWLQLFLTATNYNGQDAVLAMALDSTARREAEAALQRSEERYRIISELTSDYAFAYSRDKNGELRTSWVAGAFTRITGYSNEELDVRGGWESIVHPADLPTMLESRKNQNLGISYEQDLRILRKDGEQRWLRTFIQPRLDPSTKELTHLYGAVRDITEQKEAEEAQRVIDRRIQETQKLESIGLLAGGIAHDFNNLLVGVLGNAGLALAELPSDSPTRETIRHIEVAANHGADLTRQLLAYAGKGSIRIRVIEINTLIEEMIQLLKIGIPRQVDLVPCLAPETLEVVGDLTQIRQVLMNIVLNAAEAIGEQPGTVTITTTARWFEQVDLTDSTLPTELTAGRYIAIEVRDTGIGMDDATRQRIFEPFFSTKLVGRGLGLAAVLGIVRSHHGAIKIQSAPGTGSTFLVLLPQSHHELESADTIMEYVNHAA